MIEMEILVVVLGIALLAFDAFATWRILAEPELTRRQKTLQALVIWLLPVLGATVCFVFIRAMHRVPEPRSAFIKEEIGNADWPMTHD